MGPLRMSPARLPQYPPPSTRTPPQYPLSISLTSPCTPSTTLTDPSPCPTLGSLPLGMQNLRMLSYLNLAFNQFNGPLPPWGTMQQLQMLQLQNNRLIGSLPPAWGSNIKLRTINLSFNLLQGPIPAAWGGLSDTRPGMQELRELDL